MDIFEFQKLYPEKEQREARLLEMTDEEIDCIIESCGIVQAKIYYSSFKKESKKC